MSYPYLGNAPLSELDSLRFRRDRVTRIDRITVRSHYASPLNPVRRAHRSHRIDIPADIPILSRVAVNDQPKGSVPFCFARLDATVRTTVARDRDFPFDRYAHCVELHLVFDPSIVTVHDFDTPIARRPDPVPRNDRGNGE